MTATVRNRRGMSFVSVLFALVIIGVLYFGYFRMHATVSETRVGLTAIDASRAVACRTQRQAVDREISMLRQANPDIPATREALERNGVRIPSCPEGGTYRLSGAHVECSLHD